MIDVQTYQKLPAWRLLAMWATIGCCSFGGGASCILLIRQTFVEKDALFTAEEFSCLWNISQVTPGVTQLAVSILIGRKLGGVWGAMASFTGLLFPSAAITCLLASVFLTLERLPSVAAMVAGIIPATAGMMGWLAVTFARPLLVCDRRKRLANAASLLMILASFVAFASFQVSMIGVLCVCCLVGVPVFGRLGKGKTR
jgi:chromate transporter